MSHRAGVLVQAAAVTQKKALSLDERSGQREHHVLRAFPEHLAADVRQLLATVDHGQEVVAGQLTHLAGKAAGPIGHDDFCLAVATGVEENVSHRGVAGVVLKTHAQRPLAQRHQDALAAPAHMDEFLPVGQELEEGRHGFGGLRMGLGEQIGQPTGRSGSDDADGLGRKGVGLRQGILGHQ